MIYNQGAARRFLLGQPSTNPTIAGRFLMGEKRTKSAERTYAKHKRKAHRNNPAPALIAALGSLGGIAKRITGSDRYGPDGSIKPGNNGPLATTVADFMAKLKTPADVGTIQQLFSLARDPAGKHRAAWDAVWRMEIPKRLGEMSAPAVRMARQLDPTIGGAAAAVPTTIGGLPVSVAGQLAVPIVRELVKPARRTSTRQRYPTYVDRQGRQRYSYKPPGSEMKIPAGVTPSPGSPYSFFRGAVGKGGAAATAGQVALAAGAGIGAYLVTQRLLQHLGGRAQSKEEAGVNAALAFRQARADFQEQQGRPPNAEEMRGMTATYKAKLDELGYDPVTFTRKRSGLENFLEDYNPFGG